MTLATFENCHEHENFLFTTEASDLGLRPGCFPKGIRTTMGNSQPFRYHNHEVVDGELCWVTYRQELGCISLRVFND